MRGAGGERQGVGVLGEMMTEGVGLLGGVG